MNKEDFKELMLNKGAHLHHVGFFVKDLDKTIQCLKEFPGFQGNWDINKTAHTKEMIKVGSAPYEFFYANTNLFNTPIEIIQPIKGKSDGSYFDYVINEHGEGMHHIAYQFPNKEDYKLMLDKYVSKLVSEGYEVVSHAEGIQWEGTPNELPFEYCYVKAPAGGIFIELFWIEEKN
jgi:catechol 2,3-dioxygenase-like lactoylglutathione lyase family enzyme